MKNNNSNISIWAPNKCPNCGKYSATTSVGVCQFCMFDFSVKKTIVLDCVFTIDNISDENRMKILKQLHSLFEISVLDLKRRMETQPFEIHKQLTQNELEKVERELSLIDLNYKFSAISKSHFTEIDYSEKLKTGGTLKIKKDSWYIQYYFPGPDMRYNGDFIIIHDAAIDNYINAWKKCFSTFLELTTQDSLKGEAIISGEQNLKIVVSINSNCGGVYLRYPAFVNKPCAHNTCELNEIVADLLYAKDRALEIQNKYC